MKKLYIYSLGYDYYKRGYVVKTDYCFALDYDSYYQPITVPEKPSFTESEIRKKWIGKILHRFGDIIILEEPDNEKAKDIFLCRINHKIRSLIMKMYRYEGMKIAVENFKMNGDDENADQKPE